MGDAARVGVIVLWCGGLGALTTWSNTDAAIVAMVGISVLAGALVGRWWLPLGALGLLTGVALLFVIAGVEDDGSELSPTWLAVVLYAYSLPLAVIPAAVGVGIRRGAALAAARAERQQ